VAISRAARARSGRRTCNCLRRLACRQRDEWPAAVEREDVWDPSSSGGEHRDWRNEGLIALDVDYVAVAVAYLAEIAGAKR